MTARPCPRALPALPLLAAPLLLVLLLAGCATRGPGPATDGPAAVLPPGLAQVPDAVPRVEPLRVGGPNKPYEVFGRTHVPMTADLPWQEIGGASWYGRKFHGRPTASGEIYDMFAMTAAHRTLPIPSYARVRNPANGREVVVRINDRGPFADGRVIDLSYTAALKLDLLRGVAPVQVQRLTWDEIRTALAAAPGAAAAVSATVAPPVTPRAPPTLVTQARTPAAAANDAAPADDPLPTGGVWLQAGAFHERAAALQLQQRLQREAGALLPTVAVRQADALLRVLAGPFDTQQAALEAATWLRAITGVAAVLALPR